jgi:outer membrane protein assembly factor BamD
MRYINVMQKNLLKIVAIMIVLSLAGCGMFSQTTDETAGWSAARLYSEARGEMVSGNYERAIQHFQKLEARYPFGTYAQQAQMEIAYAHYRQGDNALALAAVERFIKLHPNHATVDYMYYLRGLVNFNDKVSFLNFLTRQDLSERDPKAARDAFEAFKLLVDRFPDSIYAPDAVARMNYLVNAMAQYEVHVANYYYRRGAYLAAANRAQLAIREYREAPAIEEALFLLVRSYDALQLTDLRDDAERVMRKNFPDSVYYRGGPDRSGPWWKIW